MEEPKAEPGGTSARIPLTFRRIRKLLADLLNEAEHPAGTMPGRESLERESRQRR